MRRELDSNVIKKHFETEDEYHFSFETSPNAAGFSCFQAHIVKEYEEGSHFAFLGFRSIDEIVQKERFYKDSLQKVNQFILVQNQIPVFDHSISKLYWLIYRMNLETGTYEEISAGNEMHKLTGKHGKTEEVFKHAINTIVDVEHQEMMKKFLDTSTLADRLKDTESIAVE